MQNEGCRPIQPAGRKLGFGRLVPLRSRGVVGSRAGSQWLTLPESGTDPRHAYTVQLQVGGLTVEGVEFSVVRNPKLYLPLTARAAAVGRP